MKENLLDIINYYDVNNQQRKLEEEIFELQESIINYENANTFKDQYLIDNIAEEISDCMVLLKQFQYYYEIADEQINKIIEFKVKRQLKRIEVEND